MSLYTVICLTMLWGLIDTTEIQNDFYDSCKWKCLIFAQLWPGSFCMSFPRKSCHIPDQVNDWTIHGLWPNGHKFCNKSRHLTKEDIDNLTDKLFHYWPSLTNFEPFKFWANEWSKHGTCAACADSMSTPHKYFSLALQLRMKFVINKAFAAAGITPSCDKGYTLNHFHTALTDFGTHVNLQCYKSTGRQILMQIKIPLSKDFSIGCQPIEDNFNKSYYHPCTSKSEIYYYPLTSHPHDPCH
ncbi:ribonuclease T2-like [Hypanus sabinus]|uniref:ribonuclease T2-like n=1 Tax=Hypanus sabinus TaxID=79690 RepID=UPI0028C47140|nr:ribonuclease T2-like [Hypanus sabinus]